MRIWTMTIEWRPHQRDYSELVGAIGAGYEDMRVGLEGPCGCHPAGTLVLMASGRTKTVESVQVGDSIMGVDGPRQVLQLHSGHGAMYRVTPIKGNPWECNADHTLVLQRTDNGGLDTVAVKDYNAQTNNWRNMRKQFSSGVHSFEPRANPELDPYFFGVWLGDGSKGTGVHITKPDPEIEEVCREQALRYGLGVRRDTNSSGCPTWHLHNLKLGPMRNPLRAAIDEALEFMWERYCTGSSETRRAWLAGFLDTDGYRSISGYEIVQKSEKFSDAIQFVARSLGLRVSRVPKHVRGVEYQRMHISGDCTHLPLRIPRKQPLERKQRKKPLRTGFRVDQIADNDWYGFEVDGDHLFLLGDFTVVHNSGKSIGYLRAALQPGFPKCNVLSTTRAHLRQLETTLEEHFPGGDWAVLRGRSWYKCCGQPKPKGEVIEDMEEARKEEWGDKKCSLGDQCEYVLAIQDCAQSQVVIQCTIGFLHRRDCWGQVAEDDPRRKIVDRDVAILDEAHEYSDVRRTYETSKIQVYHGEFPEINGAIERARRSDKGYKRGYVLLSDGSGVRLANELYLTYCKRHVNVNSERVQGTPDGSWKKRKAKALKRYHKIISLLAGSEEEIQPVVYLQWSGGGDVKETLHLVREPLFAHAKEKLAPREIFTSATLRDVAPHLGILPDYLQVFPEIFDWNKNVQTIAYEDQTPKCAGNKPMEAETMLALYESEGRPLTVALFISRKHVAESARLIKDQENVFIQGRDGDLTEIVNKARDARMHRPSPFILAYSGWVGTDIPGTKWLILGSAPLSPLGPVHEARQLRGKGGGWNDKHKVTANRVRLKQGLGRALRSPEDKAVVIWTHTGPFDRLGLDPNTGRVT